MNNRNTALFAAALLASAVLIPAASAQVGFLEEVIVTAEKRETTIQDTPIAVSAFSQDDLERGLINNSMDIQMAVPSMLMTRDFFTTSNISIRGVGNLAIGSASEAGVGVHFNGVYVNAPRIFETEFFDTERVEVLRGPQGTLYGRNTTAGVVNVISKKAGDESEGFVDASYGDYNYARFRGALNIPLTDVLSQRFSIYRTSRDGFVENIHTGNEVDDRDMFRCPFLHRLQLQRKYKRPPDRAVFQGGRLPHEGQQHLLHPGPRWHPRLSAQPRQTHSVVRPTPAVAAPMAPSAAISPMR